MVKLPKRIPKRLWGFFWDVEIDRLDPSKKPYFVIQRLLDKGDVEAVRWAKRSFPQKVIIESFTKLRDFRAKVGNFWSIFFGIPREKVLCLQPPYLKMRRRHWPY